MLVLLLLHQSAHQHATYGKIVYCILFRHLVPGMPPI